MRHTVGQLALQTLTAPTAGQERAPSCPVLLTGQVDRIDWQPVHQSQLH